MVAVGVNRGAVADHDGRLRSVGAGTGLAAQAVARGCAGAIGTGDRQRLEMVAVEVLGVAVRVFVGGGEDGAEQAAEGAFGLGIEVVVRPVMDA
jgi:hypothetical protein